MLLQRRMLGETKTKKKPEGKLVARQRKRVTTKDLAIMNDGKIDFVKDKESDEDDDNDKDDDDDKDDNNSDADNTSSEEEVRDGDEAFGLQQDCSLFPGVFEHAAMVAGASLAACNELCAKRSKIAINWIGGRHHAKKDEAAGFCYVNDVVLALLSLMNTYSRILYIDIDIHHGDGVEEAFYYSSSVFCLSFHHYSPGFYPGTGRLQQIGAGKGRYHTINVPLKAGIGDSAYVGLF